MNIYEHLAYIIEHLTNIYEQRGMMPQHHPSSLYISLTLSMNFRISMIAASGARIFAARPKVATYAQNGGDSSTGRIA